ncbi:MAG TPA: vanadium-dependent haloperoxidase [Usitatibacter sp.]|nr:vanadium-dependent haloperoxidase [Usitatibacter sp.]
MTKTLSLSILGLLVAGALSEARADAVTDWNARANAVLAEARLGTPPAVRAIAIVQTAVHEAIVASHGASLDAAIAAANRAALRKLVPAQATAIDAAYQTAVDAIPDGPAKIEGIARGEQAAAGVLARREGDMAASAGDYRPVAIAGRYVPTAAPAAPHWGARKPWLMAKASQFRPEAPPALDSQAWARDYNEVKALGARNSATRTPEQTEIARFWEYSLPPIYFGVLRSVADAPGRDVARNARLYAAAAQAMDDALISVFDAKYHYHFWRPVTAIRNGDGDGNDATERDASWASLIDAPMHPEFPSGHGILAGAVAAVIEADIGRAAMPVLATSSPTARGATRRWSTPREFVREVADSRIYAGIHYRAAVEAGAAAGRGIGELAAARYLQSQRLAGEPQ